MTADAGEDVEKEEHSSIGDPVFHLIADCEHPLLCFLGTGIVSEEKAISGSFQQNLPGMCNSVCV